MMSQTGITKLPEEMLVKIFSLLPPQDMKSVILVCKSWRGIGEDPTLWAWSVVEVNSREDFHKLSIRRFQLVQEVDVGDDCAPWKGDCQWTEKDWIDLFEVLVNLPALARLPIGCFGLRSTNLSCVKPGQVLTVFKRLEEIELCMQFSSEQSEELFSAIAENTCSVKCLKVVDESTTTLSPELFASAVSNVENVVLNTWNIKQEQMEALFLALTMEGSQLKKLEMYSCNTHDIDPALMGAAVNRLEEFEVANTIVTNDQIRAILGKIQEGGSCLNKLMLGDMSYRALMFVDSALVSKVRGKFGKFYYFDEDYMSENEYDLYGNEEEGEDVWISDEDEEDVSVEDNDEIEYVKEVKRIMGINIDY